MENKLIGKHIIDCLLIFSISFGSVAIAMNEITLKALVIAGVASLLPVLIKFRTFWESDVMPLLVI